MFSKVLNEIFIFISLRRRMSIYILLQNIVEKFHFKCLNVNVFGLNIHTGVCDAAQIEYITILNITLNKWIFWCLTIHNHIDFTSLKKENRNLIPVHLKLHYGSVQQRNRHECYSLNWSIEKGVYWCELI